MINGQKDFWETPSNKKEAEETASFGTEEENFKATEVGMI